MSNIEHINLTQCIDYASDILTKQDKIEIYERILEEQYKNQFYERSLEQHSESKIDYKQKYENTILLLKRINEELFEDVKFIDYEDLELLKKEIKDTINE